MDTIIIGSGPAGYTAAIYAARADLNPVIYTGLEPGGQLTTTTEVDNFPGYPQGVDGPTMMKELKEQIKQFLELIKDDLSNPSSAHDWRQNIYSLHGQITAKNDQVPMSAIDFWSNDILSAYHKLSFISNYRTPRAMKGYSKVFINIFPICFGPYFAFVDAQVAFLGYAVAALHADILF